MDFWGVGLEKTTTKQSKNAHSAHRFALCELILYPTQRDLPPLTPPPPYGPPFLQTPPSTRSLPNTAFWRSRDLPFVTVVTDLGGAHPTWFNPKVDKVFIASDAVMRVAFREGLSTPQVCLVVAWLAW